MKNVKWIAIAMLALIAACTGSSKITSSWKAKDFQAKKYNRIMVLGLIKDNDRSLQENMENHFVGDLKALGYDAVSSLKEYGPQAFEKLEKQAAIEKIKNSGVDAVITIVLLNKQKESKYLPGNMNYSPYSYYYNDFWGYSNTLYRRIYETGYYVTNTNYFWESNFYEMNSQALVFSVHTESFDPVNTESMAHEYGKMIVKNMVKQNVLGPNKNTPLAKLY